MDGYKRRKAYQFAKSTADRYQFKTIHRFYDKKLLHNTKFLPAFVLFLWDFSRANNIKNNQTWLCQLSNSFPLVKLIYLIAKFHKRKLKIRFSIFDCIK